MDLIIMSSDKTSISKNVWNDNRTLKQKGERKKLKLYKIVTFPIRGNETSVEKSKVVARVRAAVMEFLRIAKGCKR
jgi:hypothetical protein